MPNYEQGKIYKIIDNTNDNVYVGSTCEPTLASRLARHTFDYKYYKQGKKHYITSFKVLENNDYSIILIEDYPCENKDQLIQRERYYIEALECVNKRVEGRSKIEYRNANKEHINQKSKMYYETNIDEIKIKKKAYAESNKEKIKQYKQEHYKLNKDHINAKNREWHNLNKESQSEKKKVYYLKTKEERKLEKTSVINN